MEAEKTKNGDYKLNFKKYVVQEYLMGTSVADLQIKYNIKYQSAIARWIQKYSFGVQKHLERLEEYVETNSLQDEIQQLEDRIAELEKAIRGQTTQPVLNHQHRVGSAKLALTATA